MVTWVRIRKGLCNALLGQNGLAFDEANGLDEIVVRQKLPKEQQYNNLTWILLDRCRKADYQEMRDDLLAWADLQGNQELIELLSLVEKINCP